MLKSYVVELGNFPGWYRWDFVYEDERWDLIYTTFSHHASGLKAEVRMDHSFISMQVYDPNQIVGYVTAGVADDREDNKEKR